MRILAVFRVHNGADVLPRVLDALSGWCDDIYAIDDRSTDNSAEILRQHPAVTNLVRARSDLPRTPWLIPEPPGSQFHKYVPASEPFPSCAQAWKNAV